MNLAHQREMEPSSGLISNALVEVFAFHTAHCMGLHNAVML